MVSGRFNFKINKRFDSLIYSLVVRYLYTRRVFFREIYEEQDQGWKAQNKKR